MQPILSRVDGVASDLNSNTCLTSHKMKRINLRTGIKQDQTTNKCLFNIHTKYGMLLCDWSLCHETCQPCVYFRTSQIKLCHAWSGQVCEPVRKFCRDEVILFRLKESVRCTYFTQSCQVGQFIFKILSCRI